MQPFRQFTHGGDQYLLGQTETGYGIWSIPGRWGPPLAHYPQGEHGWNQAVQHFRAWQPTGRVLTPQDQHALAASPLLVAMPRTARTGAVAAGGNGIATAGGVIGIIGAMLSLIPLLGIIIGLIMGLLAVIFGGIGLNNAGRVQRGRGLAITGLVLGILTVIFKLIPGINVI